MGCATCGTGGCGSGGNVAGCGSKGSCSCSRLNTFDWLSDIKLPELDQFNAVEVSFKNGSRKSFFLNHFSSRTVTGDWVVVESGSGYDIGRITLSGELVKLQMKKKRVKDTALLPSIIREANDRDLERLGEARRLEKNAMVIGRAISRQLKLDMKIGDVEFQGDKRKATFYYTADGRVDFRELIKLFAKEFRVKIEMRQIGARQESARIGGIGSCGRELCCSTWLSDFKSVSTAAARYQNLAINQAKLSGQCGRLKCCLNFELDSYMDALEDFPQKADKLETEAGIAVLLKTDIFKRTMYYVYKKEGFTKFYALDVDRVKEVQAMNKKGEKPMELLSSKVLEASMPVMDYEDVTGGVELKDLEKHSKSRKRKRNRTRNNSSNNSDQNRKSGENNSNKPSNNKNSSQRPSSKSTGNNRNSNNRNSSKPSNSNKPNNRNSNNSENRNSNNSENRNSNNSENRNSNNRNSSSRNSNNRNSRNTNTRNSKNTNSSENKDNNNAPKNTANDNAAKKPNVTPKKKPIVAKDKTPKEGDANKKPKPRNRNTKWKKK